MFYFYSLAVAPYHFPVSADLLYPAGQRSQQNATSTIPTTQGN